MVAAVLMGTVCLVARSQAPTPNSMPGAVWETWRWTVALFMLLGSPFSVPSVPYAAALPLLLANTAPVASWFRVPWKLVAIIIIACVMVGAFLVPLTLIWLGFDRIAVMLLRSRSTGAHSSAVELVATAFFLLAILQWGRSWIDAADDGRLREQYSIDDSRTERSRRT